MRDARRLLHAVDEHADVLDGDAHLVAAAQAEPPGRHDARAGHEQAAGGKDVVAIEVLDEDRERLLDLRDARGAGEDRAAAPADVEPDARRAGHRSPGDEDAGPERGAADVRLGLWQIER